jgi:general secretion pathway protein G
MQSLSFNFLKKSPPGQQRRRGFTLIEILFVIGLIALLATVVITNFDSIFGGQRENVARLWVTRTIQAPLTAFRMDTGTYPTTEQGLQALRRAPAGTEGRWRGPYVEEIPLDPWNNPYQYRYPGVRNPNRYDVWSTAGDPSNEGSWIGNWRDE